MSVLHDLRYALRMLRRSPGFTLVCVALLAVGTSATPAVFSFANALFWKPVNAPHAERLVRLFLTQRESLRGEFSYPEFREFRDHAKSFEEMAAEYSTAPLNVVVENDSREHNGAVVSANYFAMVGVAPLRGRFFRPDEDTVPDRDPVVVISARLWRDRFAGEPSTVGREIKINGVAFTVIGIAPDNFYGDEPGIASANLWMPTAMLRTGYRWCDAYTDIECSPLHILGRLATGRNAQAAQTELNRIATADHLPAVRDGKRLVLLPAAGVFPEEQSELAPQMRLLIAVALLLLVIACANVAGLLLTRAVARRKEVAMRLALGARPSRVVRQLLTENLVLIFLGGGLGVLLGLDLRSSFASLYNLQSEGGRAFYDVTIDWRIVLFSIAAVLGTGLLAGLLPAVRAARCDVIQDLKSGSAGSMPAHGRLRDFLAAAQIGLSLVVLVAAGLMVRSAQQILTRANFDPDHVVVLRLRPRLVKYTPAQAESFYRAVAERLPSVSGFENLAYGVGGSGLLWTAGTGGPMRLSHPGQPDENVRVLPVNSGFFAGLRIPLLQGRSITDYDRPGSPRVVIVNKAAARRFWPERPAVGQTLVLNGETYQVVGVAADIGLHNLSESSPPQFYSAFWQSMPGTRGDVRMAVRMKGEPGAALAALHRAIAAIDPAVPIGEEMSLIEQVESVYATVLLARTATLWCGLLALVLSATGLYSVLAFAVRTRTREIGVRMALGARPADVVALVVNRGLLLCGIGTAAGLGIALLAWRFLASLLYGVQPFDLVAFVAGPLALALITLAASYLPARRAARVDPVTALRCD